MSPGPAPYGAIEAAPCKNCRRELVQQRAWEKASPAQRSVWLAEGKTTLQGRGLCRRCYLRAYRVAKRRGVLMQAVA